MEELEIFYNNKKIINNQFIKPSETQIQPKIEYNFDKNKFYTLIMYDPDAVNGTFFHWIVINIKDDIKNGKIILPYKGPAPPIRTGKHRYIFELYQQPEILNVKIMTKRNVPLNLIKKNLNLSNYISKIKFISQNDFGGKKTKKIKRRNNKKSRKNLLYKKKIIMNN